MNCRVRVEPPAAPAFERDLDAAEVVMGRVASAGLVLPDASVSRQHARLVQLDGRWWVEDLGATNGTELNGTRIAARTRLAAGDRIRVGGTIIVFEPSAPGDERTPISPAAGHAPAAAADRQAARLQLLNDIHRALATPISLTDLLDLILERCFDVLAPEEGVILLKDASGAMRPAASRQRPGAASPVLVSRRLVEEVAGKGEPALVLDAAQDERFSESESIIVAGVRSVAAAPLADAEGTIGMIALSSRVSVRQFSEADLDLLVSLASAAALRVRNVALAEEAAARRVLERELALAHDMQMAMLPRDMPARREVALAARLTPARSVGGDLYDFVLAPDGLWFIVADVSGKGVGAALYMAVAKTLFRATVSGATPQELPRILARMNQELCRDNDQMIFTTAVIGHLNWMTGALTLADIGHLPIVLVDPDGRLSSPEVPKSIAFGVLDDAEFAVATSRLTGGSVVLLYTDGATDARDASGALFGQIRLTQAIAAAAAAADGARAEAIVSSVAGAVEAFAAGAPPEDDLTLFAIEFRG